MKRRDFVIQSLSGIALASCSRSGRNYSLFGTVDKRPLEVWWQKPFYNEERDAVELIFKETEIRTGIKSNITFIKNYSRGDQAAADAKVLGNGLVPDIYFGGGAAIDLIPKLVKNNSLAAVDDIILPLKDEFVAGAIDSLAYSKINGMPETIMAVPLVYNGVYIHYWKDLLAAINNSSTSPEIPIGWHDFWNFWKRNHWLAREAGFSQTYGIGLPMSANTSDTGDIFNLFLEAYGVTVIDESGELMLNNKSQRELIRRALTDYTGFYKEKYEPPSATEWDDAENNKQFLKYNTLMTANPTLSIPASQMLDEETYFQRMGSVTWPNGLDGKPLESVLQVRPLMIFNNARSKQAKIVVSSMLNDVGLDKFVEGSQGRYLPVFKSSQRNEFWNDASDNHIQVAIKTVESFRQPYAVKNKAYSAVIKQRVWSEAIEDVALGKLDSEAATNQLVARITDIFDQWS